MISTAFSLFFIFLILIGYLLLGIHIGVKSQKQKILNERVQAMFDEYHYNEYNYNQKRYDYINRASRQGLYFDIKSNSYIRVEDVECEIVGEVN